MRGCRSDDRGVLAMLSTACSGRQSEKTINFDSIFVRFNYRAAPSSKICQANTSQVLSATGTAYGMSRRRVFSSTVGRRVFFLLKGSNTGRTRYHPRPTVRTPSTKVPPSPATMALTKKTIRIGVNPTQAPSAAISLTSPPPLPPINHNTNRMPNHVASPANERPRPLSPPVAV